MIEREDRGSVAVLRMARGKGNSVNIDFLEAMMAAVADIEVSPARAMVVTGQGRNFSAGVDLAAVSEGGRAYLERFLPVLSRAFKQIVTFPKPVVAAVNGHAIAGGCINMLAADYRLVALGDARIGLTELLVGVPFPAWAFEIARATIPPQHFASLCYTGRTLTPTEALAHGLADELVEQDQLLDRACAVAEQFAAVPAETFALTKRHWRQPLVEAAERRAAADDQRIVAVWCSDETQGHIRQFISNTIGRK
ncbi:MAG: enoyl-CoA hydratase/isomerase family protein [Planctomycetia bacterium]|nr:enoyl-CoA hydratase/isomerase family protein [Planctomycetia bacterium]